MRNIEYVLSLMLAVTVLGGMVVWTQAAQKTPVTTLSCRAGRSASPVILRGTSIYVGCPAKPAKSA